jgi:ribosomal-protein-alanine N-acetyltransferase
MQLSLGAWEIRDLTPRDAPALVKYASNRRVSLHLRDVFPYPYTQASAADFLARACAAEPRNAFAIATPAELIGTIGLRRYDDVYWRSAEIGYWLAQPFWGQGIATRAVVAFTDWAFASYDLARICAGVFETNPASARVLEKAGYAFEGRFRQNITKLGRTFDELVYARLRP